MVRGKWSEVEARGVLEAWRRSGLSLERFAKQRGLSPQRLYRWRQKLAAREGGAAPIPACTLLPVLGLAPRQLAQFVTGWRVP